MLFFVSRSVHSIDCETIDVDVVVHYLKKPVLLAGSMQDGLARARNKNGFILFSVSDSLKIFTVLAIFQGNSISRLRELYLRLDRLAW